ncbi:hypothetical protein ACOME3_005004 [Neoechinorhynchus agilis]
MNSTNSSSAAPELQFTKYRDEQKFLQSLLRTMSLSIDSAVKSREEEVKEKIEPSRIVVPVEPKRPNPTQISNKPVNTLTVMAKLCNRFTEEAYKIMSKWEGNSVVMKEFLWSKKVNEYILAICEIYTISRRIKASYERKRIENDNETETEAALIKLYLDNAYICWCGLCQILEGRAPYLKETFKRIDSVCKQIEQTEWKSGQSDNLLLMLDDSDEHVRCCLCDCVMNSEDQSPYHISCGKLFLNEISHE